MFDPILLSLITNVAGGVIANKISDYLKSTSNPTRDGILNIISKNYGSEITTKNVSIVAEKVLNIITENGGKISLGEGKYSGGGSSVEIGGGGKIDINGDAGIKMS